MMRTKLKLNPGQRGTKKLHREYGEQLVCVRYRYDDQRKQRFKTIELIVDTVPWEPKVHAPDPNQVVYLHLDDRDEPVRRQVRQAGGRWNLDRKLWALPYQRVKELGLERLLVT